MENLNRKSLPRAESYLPPRVEHIEIVFEDGYAMSLSDGTGIDFDNGGGLEEF